MSGFTNIPSALQAFSAAAEPLPKKLEHGWTMPEGLNHSHARDPRNFTLAEWQQAKRIGKDP